MPQVIFEDNMVQVSKERLLEVLRENWFKTFTIRDYHIQVYTEKKKEKKMNKE